MNRTSFQDVLVYNDGTQLRLTLATMRKLVVGMILISTDLEKFLRIPHLRGCTL
jgi:hypothetical protein